MSWLVTIGLAVAAFALAAFVLRVGRRAWTSLAAALAVGLAGYAMQASPDVPAAPARLSAEATAPGPSLKQARQEFVAPNARSRSPHLLTADAFAARGQYAEAVALLGGAVEQNPRDGESWLALANALVLHAQGTLTEPALLAYRRAAEADPGSIGASYFLGLTMLRQGSVLEGRDLWADALAAAPEGAAGRALLAERLGVLDVLLNRAAAMPEQPAPSTGRSPE